MATLNTVYFFIADEDLEFKSSLCDGNSLECPDAIICSDSKTPQLQLAVHVGIMVDAIEINGKRFGTQDKGSTHRLMTWPGPHQVRLGPVRYLAIMHRSMRRMVHTTRKVCQLATEKRFSEYCMELKMVTQANDGIMLCAGSIL